MVATNGKSITVATGLPDGQVGIRNLYSGSDSRGPAVNAVESVCIHIIRKTRRASYSGNHDITLFGVSESIAYFRQCPLKSSQNGMVATTGAPADFLVTLEIFESQC